MTLTRTRGLAGAAGVLFPLAALALGSQSCGGAAATGGEHASAPETGNRSRASDSAAEDETPSEDEAPPKGNCDDGTCSPCGKGLCPTGWYCDESASGGPACSWLPQCVQKSSCACLSGVLGSACKCAEQGGGLHVTCK